MSPLDRKRVKEALFATLAVSLAIAIACVVGCALAQPFAPNANASNTANNSAQANPTTTVELPAAGGRRPDYPVTTAPAAAK